MSAEILRKAASLMRERAEYAPDAPWTADIRESGMTWVRFFEPDDDVAMHGYPAAARHIASWHPAVALAVAAWLAECARLWEYGDVGPLMWQQANTVARAYLGEGGD